VATLTLGGNAVNHTNIDDVADITFDFADSAFTGGDASSVINATGPASSNRGVDFNDLAPVNAHAVPVMTKGHLLLLSVLPVLVVPRQRRLQ